MSTISSKEFLKGGPIKKVEFGKQEEEKEPGYFERVIGQVRPDLEQRADKVEEIRGRDTNPLLKGFQAIGQGAGAAANILETLAFEAPGVKKALEPVGKGMQWALEPSESVFEKFEQAYSQLKPDAKDTLDAAGNLVRLGTDVELAGQGTKLATNVTKKAVTGAKNIASSIPKGGGTMNKIADATGNAPQNIMDRIARLNPLKERAFKSTSGMSPGEYLTRTGNFGTPEQIIIKEAEKFSLSKSMVDDEFARLPGNYKIQQVDTALKGLIQKGSNVSSPGVSVDYLNRAQELLSKSRTQGLDMSEINEVKRLFERNVKLSYNKLIDAEKIDKATRIDSAIREWQFKKAADLGFTNVAELNKQTQVSKFLVNELGKKISDQIALNGVSLTDWIVLSGADPTAISGFLTKKFFSSKAVQARIAKMLSNGNPNKMIVPKRDFTPEYLQQEALPGPSGQKPFGRSITPAPTTFEAQTPRGTHTTTNPKTGDQYIRDVRTKKLEYRPKN